MYNIMKLTTCLHLELGSVMEFISTPPIYFMMNTETSVLLHFHKSVRSQKQNQIQLCYYFTHMILKINQPPIGLTWCC
jgi:hypothetical protein